MGVAERRQREKDQRRNDIIDAAEKIIFRDGFHGASMEQVAVEAELSKATVYSYFKNKEELYFSIFMRGHDLLYKIIDTEIEKLDSTNQKIKGFLKSFIQFKKNYPDYFASFFYFSTNRIEIDDETLEMKEHRAKDQEFLKKWVDLIEKGKRERIIREDLNPISTVLLIWLQIVGMLKMYSVLCDEIQKDFNLDEDQLFEEYYNLVLNGLYRK